jgi:hypothetical protein
MLIRVATDREVLVITLSAALPRRRAGSMTGPPAWQRTCWFTGVRGAAPTVMACSEAMMAAGPVDRLPDTLRVSAGDGYFESFARVNSDEMDVGPRVLRRMRPLAKSARLPGY